MYAYDRNKATALLTEAGHGNGLTLSLKLPPTPYARRGGEVIASQLAAIGVKTDIIQVEWAQWLEQVFKGRDYDLTVISHTEPMDIGIYARSEVNTSELQSLMRISYAVFCLKKKKQPTQQQQTNNRTYINPRASHTYYHK